MKLIVNCRCYEVEFQPDAVVVDGTTFKTTVLRDNGDATVRVAGRPYKVKVKDERTMVVDGRPLAVEVIGRAVVGRQVSKAAKGPVNCAENGAVRSPMPGRVLAVRVQEGQKVACGAVLLIVEAMKMENEIKAPYDAVVKRVAVTQGQAVNGGDVLAVIE